ncbi:MAG: alpha/beta hydrolase family protein [Woeseiaceae bacterium]
MNIRIVVLAGLYLAGILGAAASAASDAPDRYPLEYWALRSVINNAQVSPDGKYLGLMKIPSKDANPVIEVYEAANLEKEPFRLNADPMEITNFYWASDKDIVFTLRQQVRDKIEGFNQGVFETRLAVVDIKKKKMRSFEETNPAISSLLKHKPGKIIISFQEGDDDGPGSKLSEAYRPRAYWEFDLNNGTKKLLIRGKLSLGNIDFDGEGNPILARGYNRADDSYNTYYREPGGSGWDVLYSQHEDDLETFQVVNVDKAKPGNFLVYANNGDDKVGLWSYSAKAKTFDELIYRRADVDVWGVRYHTNSWEFPDTVAGVSYFTDKLHVEYFDEVEAATYKQLDEIIPYAHILNITSRSRDGNTMIINNQGPRDPGTYYLLKDGAIQSVGSQQPLLDSENLADVKYITYDARDGRQVPAYLTIPHGEGPFPLVVHPHGGPFVAEGVAYDERAQMLANNGYMVLQPQYRGSENYGLDFAQSAFENGSQIGYKMQDDKDDGAKYLVERGLVDPSRIVMYGGSYGGYASLVAASRKPQIYQCVIAQAIVSDPTVQINYLRFSTIGNALGDEQFIKAWDNAVSPVDEAANVNIPVLIIHGTVDQRTPPEQAKLYIKALEKAGKSYKYVEVKDADHFYVTWTYEHKQQIYGAMLDFLKNDCGQVSMQAKTAQ